MGLCLTPIYINDVVATIEKLIETPTKAASRLFNVCGGKVINLGEIVNALEAELGTPARVQCTDEETQYFTGDNASLKANLDLPQSTELDVGLALVVNNCNFLH